LDETYARILRDIPESDRDEALSLFRWIALSNRPLTLPELAEAAVFRPQDDCLDPEDRLCCAEDVLRICHSLVSVSNERFKICGEPPKNYNVVQFAHFSVLEYLTSDMAGRFKISDKSANTHITACCFSYLLQTDQVKLSEQSLEDYPLLRYSAEYWFEHFRELEASAQSDTTWLDRLYEFFSQVVDGSFFNWLRIQDPLAPYLQYRFSTDASEFPSPLAYASLFGLLDTAKRLLEAHHGRYNQPLHFLDAIRAAALKGHYDLVQLLLYSGADASMTAEYGSSPLAAACSGGHYQIVKLLLDHGAELDAVRSKSTALFQAAKNGHVQIVDLLLECGADVNVPCRAAHRSALQVALEYRHTKIALRLLEKGADVNATAGWSGDALTIASANGDKEMVQLLLKKGADINAAGSRDYGNALVQASFEGHCEIVEWLLEAGADVNVYGGKLWSSALAAASERGHFDIAQRLIEAGADVNYESGWSGSPLEAAERNGDGRIIRLLLDHGAKREQDCK
jgi:ankyrin repeat protein